MSKETSIYLDAVRFLAALTVVACHVGERRIGGGILWQFAPFGNIAVVVFFVLSGFVVDYATLRRPGDGTSFAVARAARIGSVAIPALIVTGLLDSVGREVDPQLYSQYSLSWKVLAASSTFLNEAWISVIPGSNEPYWSLGYEVPFYILYGVASFVSGFWRSILLVLLIALFGPRVIGFFPMWLLGVAAYRITRAGVIGRRAGWLIFIASILASSAVLTDAIGAGTLRSATIWQHSPTQIAYDYVLAMLFAANVIGFDAVSASFARIRRCEFHIKWLAGATFSLYLFHYPVLIFVVAVAPWSHDTWLYRAVLLCSAIGTSFLLAEFTERRKSAWQYPFLLIERFRLRDRGPVSGAPAAHR